MRNPERRTLGIRYEVLSADNTGGRSKAGCCCAAILEVLDGRDDCGSASLFSEGECTGGFGVGLDDGPCTGGGGGSDGTLTP
jgi:hypothetical protein